MNEYRPRLPDWYKRYIDDLQNITEKDFSSRLFPEKELNWTESGTKASAKGKSDRPITSLEELKDFFEIDLDVWMVDWWECTAWDVTSDEKGKRTNYRVKAKLVRRVDNTDFKDSLISKVIPLKTVTPKVSSEANIALELMITDLHLGKIGFDPENLEFNWSLNDARKVYEDCINYTLSKVDLNKISHFILPTGNDFFNINSPANQTVRGTPQMTGEFFQNIFVLGHQLVTAAILKLVEIAPVYVYLIPGNHDADATFSLGEVLQARFNGNENIIIDNTPILRKYHRFGSNLIGYAHGDKLKAKDAHNAIGLDQAANFAECKYKFFHLGHQHRNIKKQVFDLITKEELHGVDVEYCPSLSPVDRWHYGNLYIGNMRRSKSFLYDRDMGLIDEIYFNL